MTKASVVHSLPYSGCFCFHLTSLPFPSSEVVIRERSHHRTPVEDSLAVYSLSSLPPSPWSWKCHSVALYMLPLATASLQSPCASMLHGVLSLSLAFMALRQVP